MTFKLGFILIVLIFIYRKLDLVEQIIRDKFNKENLKYGLTSRYILSQLTDLEYQDFCFDFLKDLDYKNIKQISENYEGGVTFIADKHNINNKYIHCFKANKKKESNNIDDYSSIGRPAVQKLIGAMVKNNISNAVIITNGDLTQESMEYIKTLPQKYNIKLFTATDFSKSCWSIRQNNVKKLLQQEAL